MEPDRGGTGGGADLAVRATRLAQTVRSVLDDRALIVAANRGPLGFTRDEHGHFQARRGPGGVVTALGALGRYADPVWVTATLSPGDRARAALPDTSSGEIQASDGATRYRLRFVAPAPEVYDRYYHTIANPLLWYVQHHLWDLTLAPEIDRGIWRAWDEGYVPVNELFAQAIAVAAEAHAGGRPPVVMLHDYHLYLCARLARQRLPTATIQHFIHIPWPAPESWRVLPRRMRWAICAGLLGADIIGFQTWEDARNFLWTCAENLPDARLDHAGSTIAYAGRRTAIRVYPISIDTITVRATAHAPETLAYLEGLRSPGIERLIVRTDRAEPSKNIVRGFAAYRALLEQHPEWRGRVTFLALLNPSRLGVPQYRAYLERIEETVGAINAALGTPAWQPVDLRLTGGYGEALAGLQAYDVLLVNSLFDGMNLVAKEGPLVNQRDGVLLLSEGTGAFQQLAPGVLPISPCDVAGTAAALHQALTMSPEERARRAELLRDQVEREDIVAWLQAQLDDLAAWMR